MGKKLQFHELANVYRLMDDNELAELSADIKENGLLEPIVLYEGKILDGRNRALACEKAGVKPETVEWDGEGGTPEAFVLSKHTRRNVTAGQHAMAVARMYPDGGRGKGKDPARKSELSSLISHRYLQMARAVLYFSEELADQVTAGEALSAVYKKVQDLKAVDQSNSAKKARLRGDAPDLADLVDEGRMSLSEALGALRQREDDFKQRQRVVADSLYGVVQGWGHLLGLRDDPARDGALENLDPKSRKKVLEIESLVRRT